MTPLTPEEARDQLTAADTLATTSGTGARIGAAITAGVGVFVAVVLAMTKVLAETIPMPHVVGLGIFASTLAGLMSLVGLVFLHNRHVRVAQRGFSRRYIASFGVTMALYAIGIVWATNGSPSWSVFGPYCVLVALPMVLVASRMAPR